MNPKYLLCATLAAGLVIFVWGAFSHTALPEPIKTFKNGQAVLDAVKAQTAGNAAYYEPHGIFMTVRFGPGQADQELSMGPLLAREGLSNLVCGFLLAILLAWSRARSLLQYGVIGLLVGLTSWFGSDVSLWNWYGFSPSMTAASLTDMPVSCFLAALVTGWMIRKWFPEVSAGPGAVAAMR